MAVIMEPFSDWILATWRTNARVTAFLIEQLPRELWPMKVPGAPRRTIRMIAGHLHNNRCMWVRMVGEKEGVPTPETVNRHRVDRDQLLAALEQSSTAMAALLQLGIDRGGRLPKPTWSNLPLDVVHFMAYHVAHEAHHRGQIVMLARELGHRLPESVTTGLWQWTKRNSESGAPPGRP